MRTLGLAPRLLLLVSAWASSPSNLLAAGADDVVVPGGAAAVRRLLKLPTDRPDSTLFLDVHRRLSVHGDASWSDVEPRRRLVEFAEDVAAFRREFGDPAVLTPADPERTRRAFEALGFHFAGKGASLELEPLASPGDRRRQNLLTAFGLAVEGVREKLSAGTPVSVGSKDERAPLPFGLAAWREVLKVSERSLTAENAFVFFVKNVKASRMLVALSTLDPETREAVRAVRGAK
ncbi:MAG TPA: hypothetical protein VGR00_14140, partial [Thermoanaerobaculia bacterium]|nr:hypothetical protein [Thermoanaerobaculia bacterium]